MEGFEGPPFSAPDPELLPSFFKCPDLELSLEWGALDCKDSERECDCWLARELDLFKVATFERGCGNVFCVGERAVSALAYTVSNCISVVSGEPGQSERTGLPFRSPCWSYQVVYSTSAPPLSSRTKHHRAFDIPTRGFVSFRLDIVVLVADIH